MFSITIAPLSTRDALTSTVIDAVRNAQRLYLQTEKHPFVNWIKNEKLPYSSMDDLYELSEDFEALNANIAKRLAEAGDCVYAVTGSILDSQLAAISRHILPLGGNIVVLPGVTMAFAAFPSRRIDALCTASALPTSVDPMRSIAIEEVSSAILASEVKLTLGEYYPDDWQIQLASAASGSYTIKTLPLYELDRQKNYDATTAVYVPAAKFENLQRFGFAELCYVLRRLRAPDGCPWDREQTDASLREPLMEECYELIDAIDSGIDDEICEESGDVLMHAAFHAIIASEQGRFNERDVTSGIVQKLVYRHPHVFGDVHVHSSDEVLRNWDKLKMAEKHQKTQTEVLQSVPRCFPALTRASKVQHKAAKVGFDWNSAADALPKVQEEALELVRAMQGDGNIEEETGDLLFSAVNVARLLGLDAEFTLRDATDKFIARFAAMERAAFDAGKDMKSMSFSELDALWEIAKNAHKT